jgi:tetraacyldisaccharide 4'-kinase
MKLENKITKFWYQKKLNLLGLVLLPTSWAYKAIVVLKYKYYQLKNKILNTKKSLLNHIPVIVIGNITVGGTGKTPLTIKLAQDLIHNGYKPAIISRGYKGKLSGSKPVIVDNSHLPKDVGDEPYLMHRRLNIPVIIGTNRNKSINLIKSELSKVDIIISDDGLSNYKFNRDIEVVVFDGERFLGNKKCLPVGPLREPVSRLKNSDFYVVNINGFENKSSFTENSNYIPMDLKPNLSLKNLDPNSKINNLKLTDFEGKAVHAVAGIGHPERFFNVLKSYGIEIIEHKFNDHYNYKTSDLDFDDKLPIITTEKDAVKLKNLNLKNAWYYEVNASITDQFTTKIIEKLNNSENSSENINKSKIREVKNG